MTPSSDNILLIGRYSAKANKLTVCGPAPNIAGRAIPIKFSLREAKNIMADGRSHTFVGSRGTHLRSLAKGITRIAFVFGCGVFFSGCMVNFTDPLPGSRDFTADAKLLGRWSGTDEQGHAGFIQFDKAGSREIAVSVFGKNSDLGYKNPIFKLTTTRIGSFNYLVLRPNDSEARPDYTIARYSIDKNKLKIWLMSIEKVREAIKSGRLKGTSTAGPYYAVTVNSASSEVVRVLNGGNANDLFICLGEFERVTK